MLREQPILALLRRSMNDLLQQIPNIKEGTDEGFHQGRVAIRRFREALAIVRDQFDEKAIGGIEGRLRRAARGLGRVRDADVAHGLVQHVESRFQPASAALAELRVAQAAERLALRRRAIKDLESLDLLALPQELRDARRGRSFLRARGSGWRTTLRHHIAHRAREVRLAMDHAGGVYFPNRVHAARIAIKQLRYALELGKTTDTWRRPRAIRLLKGVQSTLGEAHDREVLIERLDERPTPSSAHDGAAALESFFRAEIEALHAKYLACRADVLALCDACEHERRRLSSEERLLLVASVAVPSLLLVGRRPASATAQDKPVERRVRIAVP